jgi:fructose-1,6-bisphosphatase/inositol monophosphatase family enzyme
MNNEYLDFAKDLAQEAGQIMRKYFRADEIGLKLKDDLSPLTLADTEINSLVIAKVKQRFPDHGVLVEEENYNLDKKQLWIVDPLDGTPTFARGIPVFAFSIALVEDGVPQVGVVYDPNTDRLFSAITGQGAYENGRQINIKDPHANTSFFISAWVVGGINGSCIKSKEVDGKLASVFGKSGNYMIFDLPIAYVMPLVAANNVDACLTTVINPWDLAAGCLIAKEAGAKVTDLFGDEIERWDKNINGVIVAAPRFHADLVELTQPILKEFK